MQISRIALAAACFGILPAGAMAQSGDPVDEVLSCREIVAVEARLACFDAASARLAVALDNGEFVTVTPDDIAAVEGDSFGFNMPSLPRFSLPAFGNRNRNAPRTHDALEGVETAQTRDSTPSPEPATEPTQVATSEASPTVSQTEPAAPPAAAPARAEVEILERREDGQVFRVTMRIERTRVSGYNTTVFYMENGQVWRQTDDIRVRMPRNMDNVTAEIRRGAMSSYLLRVNGQGRAIAVERER
jgi:hypothetical protein